MAFLPSLCVVCERSAFFTLLRFVFAVAVQSEQLPIYFSVSSLFSSCLLFTTCELASDHKGLQAAAAITLIANLANSCWLVPHQVNANRGFVLFIGRLDLMHMLPRIEAYVGVCEHALEAASR